MYAENSDKTLVKVIPTTFNLTGKTSSWEVHMHYSFPAAGYTTSSVSYASTIVTTVGVRTYNSLPTGFTSTTIKNLVNAKLDLFFNEEYKIENGLSEESLTPQVGFALTQLSS